jgi:SAM-dependent methyltransferase
VAIVKDIVTNAARAAVPSRWLYERLRPKRPDIKRSAAEEAEYARSVYRRHSTALDGQGPLTGSLLEIGPGGSLAVSGLFLEASITTATCIDVEPLRASEELEACAILGVEGQLGRIKYVCPATIEDAPFEDSSFDLVISQAVLEHVRSPAKAVAEIARVLRPGGLTSNQIDLRDHRDFDQSFAFLRHSALVWRAATSHRIPTTNRWRRSDFVDGFRQVGLEVISADATEVVDVTAEDRNKLARPFKTKSLDDLSVLGVHVVARKPT